MKKLWEAIKFLILIVILYMLFSIVVGFTLDVILSIKRYVLGEKDIIFFSHVIKMKQSDITIISTIMVNILTLIGIRRLFVYRLENFMKYVNFSRISWTDTLLFGILGFCFNLIINMSHGIIINIFHLEELNMAHSEKMVVSSDNNLALLIIVMVIIAPIFEEIICRGVILNDFRNVVPLWLAIFIQALFFGVIHMNILQGIYAFVLGIIFSILYLWYRSIWVPIILHGSFNLTSLILVRVIKGSFSLEVIIILGLIGIIGCGVTVFMLVNKFKKINCQEQLI